MEFLLKRLGKEIKVKVKLGGIKDDILCATIKTKGKFLGFEFWWPEVERSGVHYVKGVGDAVNWKEKDYLNWVVGIVHAGVTDEERGILKFNELSK